MRKLMCMCRMNHLFYGPKCPFDDWRPFGWPVTAPESIISPAIRVSELALQQSLPQEVRSHAVLAEFGDSAIAFDGISPIENPGVVTESSDRKSLAVYGICTEWHIFRGDACPLDGTISEFTRAIAKVAPGLEEEGMLPTEAELRSVIPSGALSHLVIFLFSDRSMQFNLFPVGRMLIGGQMRVI